MRTHILALGVTAALLLPSGAGPARAGAIEVGPGGVHFGWRHHQRHYGYGADCRELRDACMHKEELGETGRGNCRRYREVCRGD
jgi:hypothetical protein